MKNKALMAILCSFLLAGCSTTRLNVAASKEVPAERMFWESGGDENRGNSKIIIKRDAGVVYSACVSNVFFQGLRVAELYPGEKVTLAVNSGEYMIGEFLSSGACLPFLKTLLVKVKPNSINVFRIKTILMGANGGDMLVRDNDI
ncbi:hypothetical protein [Xenorhabdus sp. TH1]|uniref:hypothetical protein n=1 Tax=Xenorhabdus sp. TH1 TaxID=3130166 RepID=UPI0030D4A688